MPRTRIEDPAAQLSTWLVWEHESSLTAATARVYGSIVRAVVRALGDEGDTPESSWRHVVNPEKVESYFCQMWEDEPARYERTVRPWNLFREWGETKGLAVAAVPDPRTKRAGLCDPPAGVLHAVHYLVSRRILPLKVLPHLVWDDVQEGKGDHAHVRDPRHHGTFVIVPLSVVKNLRTFAAPSDGLAPLIPVARGERTPFPTRPLGNALKRYRRKANLEAFDDVGEQIAEMRKRQGDGSALGAAGVVEGERSEAERSNEPCAALPDDTLASLMAYDPEARD